MSFWPPDARALSISDELLDTWCEELTDAGFNVAFRTAEERDPPDAPDGHRYRRAFITLEGAEVRINSYPSAISPRDVDVVWQYPFLMLWPVREKRARQASDDAKAL